MDRFGMDLGTVNSALCYYNEERKTYDFLKIGNQTRDFFPTMIAYEKKNYQNRFIGEEAKKYQFSKKYDVYSLFKLSLGEGAHACSGREKSPYEAAKDFLEEVIRQFQSQTGCKDLNNLVLTVPDVWKNEDKNRVAVDNLMKIFEELGLEAEEQAALESEPVSAAAYYCRQVCDTPYNGYVIVIDYGGGTLDLTLCKVEDGKNITVLRRCGDGGANAMGCAGLAFDTALTHRLIKNNALDETDYEEETNRFGKLRNAVENAKIGGTDQTQQALKEYYSSYGCMDLPAFEVIVTRDEDEDEEYTVMASDVAEVFQQVNAPALEQALKTIKDYCEELNIDPHSQENMRILMVGGFSNLYCVEATCREAFASDVSAEDRRFDPKMRQGGRCSTAIAQGAGIIAAGAAKIDYYCQSDVGFFYYDVCEEREKAMAVIRRDTPVREYKQPKYDETPYTFRDDAQNLQVRLFFDDGKGIVPVKMDESFRELFGDTYEEDSEFYIGFSMGRHRIPTIHIKNQKGQENSISLNRVLSRIALRKAPKSE